MNRPVRLFLLAAILIWTHEVHLSATPLGERILMEQENRSNPWVILPHRQNYVLPVSYNPNPNEKPLRQIGSNAELDEIEIKFQISFKFPVWEDVFGSGGTLFVGYTQLSLWQAYNGDESEPFRDTNYEPELFMTFPTNKEFLGLFSREVSFGFAHQSNGRGFEAISRSWNRLFVSAVFERGNLALFVKPWIRVSSDDENPGIDEFLGYGDFQAAYKWRNHTWSLLLRNNFRTKENRGAIQLDWSFPLLKRVKGYIQFFNGYAETLLDFDVHSERIGVGLMLADWL